MKKILLIIFIGTIITSCKKFGNGYVKGTVYEDSTFKPVPNAIITLWRSFHASEHKPFVETVTDAAGNFNLNYRKALTDYSYYVTCTKNIHSGAGDFNDKLIYKKTERHFVINYVPTAYLIFKVKNNSTTTQSIWLNADSCYNYAYAQFTYPGQETPVLNPSNEFTSIVFQVKPNKKTILRWGTSINNMNNIDSIYTTQNDTAVYFIQL